MIAVVAVGGNAVIDGDMVGETALVDVTIKSGIPSSSPQAANKNNAVNKVNKRLKFLFLMGNCLQITCCPVPPAAKSLPHPVRLNRV
jgi:hypothetical protein